MSSPGKGGHQPAFVLHAQAYKETSLIVELFTRDHGRVSVVARGARRPRAALRGLLLPFQPLVLGWFGKTELKTLAHADWQGALPQLGGVPLLAGLYLNELLLRLTAREDPHPALFADYAATVRAIGPRDGRQDMSALLRRFELRLLAELGYADASSIMAKQIECVGLGEEQQDTGRGYVQGWLDEPYPLSPVFYRLDLAVARSFGQFLLKLLDLLPGLLEVARGKAVDQLSKQMKLE